MAVVFASCVKHELYNTNHPDRGALVVTTDFSERSAEVETLPDAFPIKLLATDDNIVAEMSGRVGRNVYGQLFEPKVYRLFVHNTPADITINGTVATVDSRGDGFIAPMPEYLFGHFSTVNILADDTTRIVAKMKQYVRLLTVTLNVKEGDYSRITSATATLDGVVAWVDLRTGTFGDYGAKVKNSITRNGQLLFTSYRLLGVCPKEKNIFALTINFADGDTKTYESDITDQLSNFNDGKTQIDLKADLSLPEEAHFRGNIEGWEIADGSSIVVD